MQFPDQRSRKNGRGGKKVRDGNKTKWAICDFYRANPQGTQAECAAAIGVVQGVVSYHVRDMRKNGIPDRPDA